MKIRSIENIFLNKKFQEFYKKCTLPKSEKFINSYLPVCESALCTGAYVFATARDKGINKERKPILQWQNVLSGIFGMTLSAGLNKRVGKMSSKIEKGLNPELIKDFNKVRNGLFVGLPIMSTTIIMRFFMPLISVPLSDVANYIVNKKKLRKKSTYA